MQNEISIFPNPSTGYLTISSPLARIENVNVYDLQGRTLDMEITWSPRKVHVTTAYRGLTIIKIQTENGLQVKKMVFE